MAALVDVKSQLPYPFDQDLAPVLQRLNRRTERGRVRLANDPVTAAYLAAALRLIEQRLAPAAADGGAGAAGGPGGSGGQQASVLSFLSQRAVAAAVAANPHPFPRRGSVSTLRTIWRTQADFVTDLLGFALWTGYYPASYQAVMERGTTRLTAGPDFARQVQAVAYAVTDELLGMLAFRIQVAAALDAAGDPAVRTVLSAKYLRGRNIWARVYGEMIAARGLRLRDGMTVEQLADVLTATVEGCGLRALASGGDAVLADDGVRSLLGVAALAVLNGALVPADDGTALTLTESLNTKSGTGAGPDRRSTGSAH